MPRILTDAQRDLAAEHVPMVAPIAKLFTRGLWSTTAAEAESSGYLGLCHAAAAYDPSLGPFERYAGRAIRRQISQDVRRRAAETQSYEYFDEVLLPGPASAAIDRIDAADWIASLRPGDRKIIEARLRGEMCEAIGDGLGVTATRVRQRIAMILRTLPR